MSYPQFGTVTTGDFCLTLDKKLRQGDRKNIEVWNKGLLHSEIKNFIRSVIILIIQSERKGQMHGSLNDDNIGFEGNSVELIRKLPSTLQTNQVNNLRVEFKLLVERLITGKVGSDVNLPELHQFLHLINLHLPLEHFACLFYHPLLLLAEERFHAPLYAVTDARLMAGNTFWRNVYNSVLGGELIDIEDRIKDDGMMRRVFRYREEKNHYEKNHLAVIDFSRNVVVHANDSVPIRMTEAQIEGRLRDCFPKLQIGIFSTLLEGGHLLDFSCQNRENDGIKRLLGVVNSSGYITQSDGSFIKVEKDDLVTEQGCEAVYTVGQKVEYQISFNRRGEKCASNVTEQYEVPLQGRRKSQNIVSSTKAKAEQFAPRFYGRR